MTLDPNVGKWILQLVLWLPLVGAIVVAFAGNGPLQANPDTTLEHDHPREALSLRSWRIATVFAVVVLLLSVWLMLGFDRSQSSQYQFQTNIPWLPFGSNYRIAVDGLSMPLVVLNALLSLSAIAGSWRVSRRM